MSSMNLSAIAAVWDWQKRTGLSVLTYRADELAAPPPAAEALASEPKAAEVVSAFTQAAPEPVAKPAPSVAKGRVHPAIAGTDVIAGVSHRPAMPSVPTVTAEDVIRKALPFSDYSGHPSEVFEALAVDPALKLVAQSHLDNKSFPPADSYWKDTMPAILKSAPLKDHQVARKRRAYGD